MATRLPLIRGELDNFASLARAAVVLGRSAFDHRDRTAWPDDRTCEILTRAPVSPFTTSDAAALAPLVPAMLAAITPASAGAALLAQGLQLQFGGNASITLPTTMIMPVAGFIGQGKPIPVVMGTATGGGGMDQHKLAVITELTSEVLRSTNAEALTRQALVDSLGPGLDAILFSDLPADEEHAAGLLFGVPPIDAAAAGDNAMTADLAAVLSAVAPLAGNGGIAIVTGATQAVSVALRSLRPLPYQVHVSDSLAPGTVIGVSLRALVAAIEPAPRIDSSIHVATHMSDTPQPLADIGGGVMASTIASTFQSDRISIRVRWPMSWAMRATGGVAWVTGANW